MSDPKQKSEFDNIYTPETAPGVVESGAVKSKAVDIGDHEGTYGVMDPGTIASFPADKRGERITLAGEDLLPGVGEASSSLALTIIDPKTGESRDVTLDPENPAVQVPGGHQINVDLSKVAVPTVYTCEFVS